MSEPDNSDFNASEYISACATVGAEGLTPLAVARLIVAAERIDAHNDTILFAIADIINGLPVDHDKVPEIIVRLANAMDRLKGGPKTP